MLGSHKRVAGMGGWEWRVVVAWTISVEKLTGWVNGIARGSKNSPGSRNVVPYTSSAAVQWISSLSAVCTPWEVTLRSWVGFQGGFELTM